ncbi:4-hydroxybenzoyl-CoA thioesterase family active site [Marinobacterium lacunae]|uniref:4-hydroxybenzoyl-CoA thioesterase family active site n=1 Tax=Marinobacterium lacunae TaxID=1232683 RepID=A0A081FYP5_9GAMM|nr:acyl-CoA thioesterase [Marinobacterium lacunae]KEA63650.1 4-hydroxybenzoyl-CoA thioesterase family active site [Marinobacterium lacunae]
MLISKRRVLIEWGDCDPAGIVFYPRYFAYFDASTAHLFRTAGLEKFDLRKRYNIVGFPMVDTRASFKIPSRYGEVIEIHTCVEKFKKTSFDILHQVFKEDGQLAIECWETRVWLGEHPEKPKPRAIPDDVIALLSSANT